MLNDKEDALFKVLVKLYRDEWNPRSPNYGKNEDKFVFCWEEVIEHEMFCAQNEGLVAPAEGENHDDLADSLERLFCSGEKADFMLAKQIFSGLVFTESMLKKLILSIYQNIYIYKKRGSRYGYYPFMSDRAFAQIMELNKMARALETTEEELEVLKGLIEVQKIEMISACLLPIFPNRIGFSKWCSIS